MIRDFETHLRVLHRPPIGSLLSGNVLKDPHLKVIGYVLLIKDITENKRAERALLNEKKTIEGILEGSPIAMFVVDHSHQVIHWNKACEQLTGKSKAGDDRDPMTNGRPSTTQPRPLMADLIIEEDIQGLQKFYGDKMLKESPLIPGAYQAEDFFPLPG